jgi:hypothetical protein
MDGGLKTGPLVSPCALQVFQLQFQCAVAPTMLVLWELGQRHFSASLAGYLRSSDLILVGLVFG